MSAPPHLELGQTEDPHQLIPGDVATVNANAQALADERRLLRAARRDIDGITAQDAIDAGIAALAYSFDRTDLLVMFDDYDAALKTAHDAITTYSVALRSAQHDARVAIRKWNEGNALTDQAIADGRLRTHPVLPAGPDLGPLGIHPAPAPVVLDPLAGLIDPGAPLRAEAQTILADARQSLLDAAAQALYTLGVDQGDSDGNGKPDGGDDRGDSPFTGPRISWDGWKRDFGKSAGDILDKDQPGGEKKDDPWSLSLGSIEGGIAVYDKDGHLEDYFGDVKVEADGSVKVLGLDGKAEATITRDGVVVGIGGTATLVGLEGSVSASLGPAEVGVDASASVEASADGELKASLSEGVHAGGEAFAGGRADVGLSGDVGGVGAEGKAEGWAGFGAAADAEIGWKDGKLTIKGEGGVAVLLGGKLSGGVTLDLPEIYGSAEDLVGFLIPD